MNKFIETPIPFNFVFREFFFGKTLTPEFSIISQEQDFREICTSFKLDKNTLWLSTHIHQEGEAFFKFISEFCPFPFGLKGRELAKLIYEHPLKEFFKGESPSIWQTIVKLPVPHVQKYLISFSGSRLRELANLMEEILRGNKTIVGEPELNFEKFREYLISLRYEKVSEQREQNLLKSRTLPQPWKANFIGLQSEQMLELKAVIKDKVDLERAKNLFDKKFADLEEIVSNLT